MTLFCIFLLLLHNSLALFAGWQLVSMIPGPSPLLYTVHHWTLLLHDHAASLSNLVKSFSRKKWHVCNGACSFCLSTICAMQSRSMTNAHAIVPGMPPSSAGRGPNTAWQVGLAAGLAATANLRPPKPSLGHQAATTAAAARAAAAFQASRALSMAKSHSQQSPLLQQGSVGANVSGESCSGQYTLMCRGTEGGIGRCYMLHQQFCDNNSVINLPGYLI